MLRKCLLVLSNPFYNEFYEVHAEIIQGSEDITKHLRTYQQRLFQDGDILNYRPRAPFDFVFGVAATDNVDSFMEEVGIQFSDEDNDDLQKFICLKQDLDYLHGLFVAKGLNSIVTLYFSD